ncbi:hypothetical protein [Demequina salsinemoris]|uniref:hypothetical protein n=1 Tax=Demequina salsinemoris TaxID=577470 RepID=UPI0007801CFA|nr:hypothetical protein [Demequina salsinemoris]
MIEYNAWRKYLRSAVRQTDRQLKGLYAQREGTRAKLDEALRAHEDATALDDMESRHLEQQLKGISRQVASYEGALARVEDQIRNREADSEALHGFWPRTWRIRRNEANIRRWGRADALLTDEAVTRVIASSYNAGANRVLKDSAPLEMFNVFNGREAEHVARLRAELEVDPLDLLRVKDKRIYLELDRERAEVELRLAIAVPLAVLVAQVAYIAQAPWVLALGLLPGALLVNHATSQTREAARVLRHLEFADIETPAMVAARASGEQDAREALRNEEREQRLRKKQP